MWVPRRLFVPALLAGICVALSAPIPATWSAGTGSAAGFPAAPARDPDDRCADARVWRGPGGFPAALDAGVLRDGRRDTGLWLDAAKGEFLEFDFPGAPRWLNRIRAVTDASAFDVEVRQSDGAWVPCALTPGPEAAGPARLSGGDVFVRGIRFKPRAAAGGGLITVSEFAAEFDVVDPDGLRVGPAASGYDIHANWCNHYPGRGNDLSECDDDVNDLIDDMPGTWSSTTHGNANSHEEHFKRADLGGLNSSHADDADLAYFAGHGSTANDTDGTERRCLRFGDTTHDDRDLTPGEAVAAWGNGDMEWMCLSACQTLSDAENSDRWFQCMAGLHQILGFRTNMRDVDLGDDFADYMVDNGVFDTAERVKTAWFDAAEDNHGDGYTAKVIAEDSETGRDYVWGEGATRPDAAHDAEYSWWTYHTCGFPCVNFLEGAGGERVAPPADPVTFPATTPHGHPVIVDRSLLQPTAPTAMTVYNVSPVLVDSNQVRAVAQKFCSQGGHFCGGRIGPGNPGHLNLIDGVHELRVCQTTGSVHYHDAGNWLAWRTSPPSVPSGAAATTLADNLLGVLGRRRTDAVVDRVDFAWQGARMVPATGVAHDIPESTFATAARVVYKRRLGGLRVAGPGASMTVALGGGGQLQRLFEGAWRKVAAGAMVNVVPISTALSFLAAHGADATVDGTGPWTEQIQVNSWELGYYEYSSDVLQTTLRPVYILHCTIVETPAGHSPPVTSPMDVHLWAEALPPEARIDWPPDGALSQPGAPVCFSGSGSGGISPLTLTWADDLLGPIGSGGAACAALNLPGAGHNQSDSTHTVTLTVRDALGREAHASVGIGLRPGVSGVTEPAAPAAPRVQALLPNPTLGSTRLLFSTARAGSFHLEVFDVSGRRIHAGATERLEAGEHRLEWDGRADSGRPAAAGVYHVTLVGAGTRVTRKAVVVR